MKKIKIYLDTSVLGGLFDAEDPKRVKAADGLIRLVKEGLYEGFISFLTIEEVLNAPLEIQEELKNTISDSEFKILEETEECIELANTYVNDEAIPQKFRNDARHMVNITVRRLINSTNLKMGYNPIEIISPEEVIGYGEVGI